MKRIIWAIQAALFYLFTWLVAGLPRSQTIRIGTAIGTFLFNVLHSRRTIAIDNIRQALPFMKRHPLWTGAFETAEEITLATFRNLGISIVEVCRLYHGKGSKVIDSIEVRGGDNLRPAREKKKGLIFIGGHCGNWELMSLSFKKLFNENVWAIVRHQKNPYLNAVVEKMRMSYGNKVIYNKAALKKILSVIKNDGVIGMLADQAVFENNGVLIEFLGRKALANKAPAVIAHKTGVPLVPVFIHREGNRHVLTIHPEHILCGDRTEDGIGRDIQALAHYLEDFVCAHPADWYWVHRRWKRAGQSTLDNGTM
ncbi:MAG: lysophospholipid acyltransferase family protein [Desulfuromonadaceae bacterium]|nr:lysophospholipid acyltransferase family protein [Desulfuromonadaceae bacterium]